MKQIHIKLDEEMHRNLKIKCAKVDRTIQEYVTETILKSIREENDLTAKPLFRFIDLFAGIGGIRIPFEEVGGKCVMGSEIDKYARTTYKAWFGEFPEGDISQIKPCAIPDFDILTGGFPCQPFSLAGHKKGFTDTRGTLFFEIEKILRCKTPPAFLLENVKHLKGHDKGNTYRIIIETLNSIGYHIKEKVLKARDFGLPQNRERIFIVGFLDESHYNRFSFPEPTNEKTIVGDILEKNPDSKYTISDKLWAGHQRRKKEHKEKGNGFGYGLVNAKSEYTNTISARYYKDGSEILIEQKGKNPRKLTPFEAARLQGFPPEIVNQAKNAGVSDAQLYKQFGNAVPVNVIRHIASNMIHAMQED